ncbi:MAG: DUF559 domain-containing protein [Candidatus Paracaedibacteraceae bacterium]|nr:DUF559 domain-containing protein [Candidatus Paracaedibacteraceae bacterium]
MSKSYRADSNYAAKRAYHHTHHQLKHKKRIEGIQKKSTSHSTHNVFDATLFFKEIMPLINFQGIFTDKERNTLKHWLHNAYLHMENDAFTSDVMMRFIYKTNNMAKRNLEIRNVILTYFHDNPDFGERLLNYSQTVLDRLNAAELSQLILFLVHVHIYPNAKWLSIWNVKTEELIVPNFDQKDLKDCLEALSLLKRVRGLYITYSWMERWFEKSQQYLETMQAEQLCHLIALIGMSKTTPPDAWIHACMLRSSDLLNGLTGRCLFQFENAFFIEQFRNHPTLIENWLKYSLMEMKDADSASVMMCLLPLVHNNVHIPNEWLDAWMEKIVVDFDNVIANASYRVMSIAYGLYALALLQKDVEYCEPFLRKCNIFFSTREYNIKKEYSAKKLRKIIFARNYFEQLGFTLNSTEASHANLIAEIDHMPKKGSTIQTEFFEQLRIMFGSGVKEEAHIDIIIDSVDFLVAHKNLIVEVDGHHHFVDGAENALTRVKTKMLKRAGYHVRRFTVDADHHENLPQLLRAELIDYV